GGAGDVSWGGPMRIVFAHDRDPESDIVGFCEIVTRDPFFIIGCEPRPEFSLGDLQGLRLGAVSEVPTPFLCLTDDLLRAEIDPASLAFDQTRTMAENEAALRSGALDAIQVSEPFVTRLCADGAGHIWYAAANRGPTSYTTLFARRAVLEERRDMLLAMTRALYRTQRWVHSHDAGAIAAAIESFFPDIDTPTLTDAIARYQSLGIWGRTPRLPQGGFERLRDACQAGGLIASRPAYDACIDTTLADAVLASDPPPLE
ncbi:MAG: ABC transporter substrate-binding protein, partial [Alphaproteobacteria bacterium]